MPSGAAGHEDGGLRGPAGLAGGAHPVPAHRHLRTRRQPRGHRGQPAAGDGLQPPSRRGHADPRPGQERMGLRSRVRLRHGALRLPRSLPGSRTVRTGCSTRGWRRPRPSPRWPTTGDCSWPATGQIAHGPAAPGPPGGGHRLPGRYPQPAGCRRTLRPRPGPLCRPPQAWAAARRDDGGPRGSPTPACAGLAAPAWRLFRPRPSPACRILSPCTTSGTAAHRGVGMISLLL